MSNSPQPDFGSCWSCITDLTFPSVMVSGFRVIAEAIVRRWSTPAGGLIDDPTYGYDITDAIGDDLDQNGIATIENALAAEAEKDERVLSCSATVTLDTTGKLTVVGLFTTAQGPFKLVASVQQIGANLTLLQVTPGG